MNPSPFHRPSARFAARMAAVVLTLGAAVVAHAHTVGTVLVNGSAAGPFKQGDCNTVTAQVTNTGSTQTTLSVYLHLMFPNGGQGQYQANVALAGGASGTATFASVSAPNTGNYGVTVRIGTDTAGQKTSSIATSGSCTAVGKDPDLAVRSLSVAKAGIGYCTSVNAAIINFGPGDAAGNIRVLVKLKAPNGTESTQVGLLAGGINAKQVKGVIVEGLHMPVAGAYTVEAFVDDVNQVVEVNEGNNVKTQPYTAKDRACK